MQISLSLDATLTKLGRINQYTFGGDNSLQPTLKIIGHIAIKCTEDKEDFY